MRNSTIAALLGGLAELFALPTLGHASPLPEDTNPARSSDVNLSITDFRDQITVGADTAYTVTATLVEDPGQDRVATTVCAGWREEDTPLVCADDESTVGTQNGGMPLGPFRTGVALASGITLLGPVAFPLRRGTGSGPGGRHARHRPASRR